MDGAPPLSARIAQAKAAGTALFTPAARRNRTMSAPRRR
jgi:uncharacterized protein GlcG (DUF336 family)